MDGEKGHEQWENWEVALGTLDFIFERLVDFLTFSWLQEVGSLDFMSRPSGSRRFVPLFNC